MNIFFIAVLHNIIWSNFEILVKKISDKVPARDALGIHLFFIPLGIIGILVSYFLNPTPITDNIPLFVFYMFGFAGIVLIENYLGYVLFSKLDTSSFFKLALGLSTSLALLFDYIFFNSIPSIYVILAGVLFIFSGILLDKSKDHSKLSLKIFGVMLFNVLMGLTAGIFFKKYFEVSTNYFVSIYILQVVTQLLIGGFGARNLKNTLKNDIVKSYKWIYVSIIFFGVITEYYVYTQLSLFMISAVYNIRFLLFII